VRTWPALVFEVGPGVSRGGDVTDGDLLQAALVEYSVTAIDEPSQTSMRAFFNDAAERDRALPTLRSSFPHLQISAVDVPDEDWASRSQADLTAVHVGNIVVAPPWDIGTAPPKPGTARIVIQPSMGFGTGHHATTRLCLAALQRARVAGRSVVDVGTGSGVLAIAASLLGASPVIAVDNDSDAIQSARENLALNPRAEVDLRVGDLRSAVLGVSDIVLANLTGTLLQQAASHLAALLSPRGQLIVSGLLAHEEPGVTAAFPSLAVLDRTQEDEWVCLVMTRGAEFL